MATAVTTSAPPAVWAGERTSPRRAKAIAAAKAGSLTAAILALVEPIRAIPAVYSQNGISVPGTET